MEKKIEKKQKKHYNKKIKMKFSFGKPCPPIPSTTFLLEKAKDEKHTS